MDGAASLASGVVRHRGSERGPGPRCSARGRTRRELVIVVAVVSVAERSHRATVDRMSDEGRGLASGPRAQAPREQAQITAEQNSEPLAEARRPLVSAGQGEPSMGRQLGPAAQAPAGAVRPRVRLAGAGLDPGAVRVAVGGLGGLATVGDASALGVAPDCPRAAGVARAGRACAATEGLGGGGVGHGVSVPARGHAVGSTVAPKYGR